MPDVAQRPPFDAYAGDLPFVFVSYAHADGAEVFPDIEALHREGVRIWYDEGIDPGNEWPEDVARALARAAQFLVFVSPRSVASTNVRNEINFALNNKKAFVAVHLRETQLPPGLELRMGDLQAILKYRMGSENYARKLLRAVPNAVRESLAPLTPGAVPGPVAAGPARVSSRRKALAGLGVGLALAAGGAWWLAPFPASPFLATDPAASPAVGTGSFTRKSAAFTVAGMHLGKITVTANPDKYSVTNLSDALAVAGVNESSTMSALKPLLNAGPGFENLAKGMQQAQMLLAVEVRRADGERGGDYFLLGTSVAMVFALLTMDLATRGNKFAESARQMSKQVALATVGALLPEALRRPLVGFRTNTLETSQNKEDGRLACALFASRLWQFFENGEGLTDYEDENRASAAAGTMLRRLERLGFGGRPEAQGGGK